MTDKTTASREADELKARELLAAKTLADMLNNGAFREGVGRDGAKPAECLHYVRAIAEALTRTSATSTPEVCRCSLEARNERLARMMGGTFVPRETPPSATSTPEANVEKDKQMHGWKCNNCGTIFTSHQQDRKPDDDNGGPNCPCCKAWGQFTYPYALHSGDPCTGCGLPHDVVPIGSCRITQTPEADVERARIIRKPTHIFDDGLTSDDADAALTSKPPLLEQGLIEALRLADRRLCQLTGPQSEDDETRIVVLTIRDALAGKLLPNHGLLERQLKELEDWAKALEKNAKREQRFSDDGVTQEGAGNIAFFINEKTKAIRTALETLSNQGKA